MAGLYVVSAGREKHDNHQADSVRSVQPYRYSLNSYLEEMVKKQRTWTSKGSITALSLRATRKYLKWTRLTMMKYTGPR